MPLPLSRPRDFRERCAIAASEGVGLLLDLDTGGYFRTNATATAICLALTEGRSPAEAEADLVRRYGVSRAEAADGVAAIFAALDVPPSPRPASGLLTYGPTDNGYALGANEGPGLVGSDEDHT